MGGGGGFSMTPSPYDQKSTGFVRNFTGKCASAPMGKVGFGMFLLTGLSIAVTAATSMNGIYHPRFATWSRPAGAYKGVESGHH